MAFQFPDHGPIRMSNITIQPRFLGIGASLAFSEIIPPTLMFQFSGAGEHS